MIIFAIDPGPTHSAYVRLGEGGVLLSFDKLSNDDMLLECRGLCDVCVIEQVASMGMAVGAEVFETVFWSGRFAQAVRFERVRRIKRHEVKMALCGNMRAKDPNIRQAIIDRYGGPACVRKGGALYRVSGDCWSALAVALVYLEQMPEARR